MLERQKRLNDIYEHLHNHFGVHTKGEFADAIGYARAYISSALNGNEKNLTDKLFTTICDVYKGVFNLDYLLTGEGNLLTIEEYVISERIEKTGSTAIPAPPVNIPDMSSVFNSALAAKDETIVSLKRELSTKDDLIQSLRDQLAAKDQLIAEQKARLIDYRRIIDSNNGLQNWPFPIGAAEDKSSRKSAQK